MLQILVGPTEHSKPFFVHHSLITSRSRFFANALKHYDGDAAGKFHWLEGEEGIVKLPADEPAIFANYIQLLYQGCIPTRAQINGNSTLLPAEELNAAISLAVNKEYEDLAKLYVLCEKLQDSDSKAAIITAFVQASLARRENGRNYSPNVSATRLIYDGTMACDPLRDFCVDSFVILANEHWVKGLTAEHYHPEYVFDVMVAMTRDRPRPADRTRLKNAERYCRKLLSSEVKVVGAKGDEAKGE
jgi:hypothetical protein